jgi:hypothetical protein
MRVAGQADHVGHGQHAAPPVSPVPDAASRSCSVVVIMMHAGSPLCWPSLPDANSALSAALRASWLRCVALRVSRCTAWSAGGPSTTGASSSGLAMPGAASLASTASRVARASGVSQPLSRDIPSMSWLPRVRPRRRARSMSVKLPSG